MTDKDIIIIRTKTFTLEPEEYEGFDSFMRTFDDETTKIIVVPSQVVEKVERL